ncbi:MAG: DUF1186 domain-containing protein [bacterium]
MSRGGKLQIKEQKLEALIKELHHVDCWIDFKKLKEIVSYGQIVVPHLEEILQTALKKSSGINITNPPTGTDWFIVVHALYLLAQLRSEDSLDLVLAFLSQEQEILNYWLQDLLIEDIWEVVYFLGQNQLEKLEAFILNQNNNIFSRLAVGTALIQISAHDGSKKDNVARIIKKVLGLEKEDPDFIGLLSCELLDIKDEALRTSILEALEKHDVWPGLVSADEVQLIYKNKNLRAMIPLDIFQRYENFRQYAYFAQTSPFKPQKRKTRQKLANQT